MAWVGDEGEETGPVVEIEQLRKHPSDSALLVRNTHYMYDLYSVYVHTCKYSSNMYMYSGF